MPIKIFDGKKLAEKILRDLSKRVERLRVLRGKSPQLSVFYFSGFPASESFVKAKLKACEKIGIRCLPLKMDMEKGERHAISILKEAAQNPDITALSIIKPIPRPFDFPKFEALIPWQKDAEGLTPFHYGRLFATSQYSEIQEKNLIIPATAGAIAEILKEARGKLAGKKAVVLGRSAILGLPAAHLLSAMNLTVTLCHSQTQNLSQEVRQADVLVSGIGRPHLIRGSWIKKGVVIIDAGTTSVNGKILGDVDFNSAIKTASFITPVPGGVGPITTALLLKNVVLLAERKDLPQLP